MDVLKAIAAWLSTHTTTILGSAQTFVAATLGAAAAKQIPDLIAVDSRAFQLLVLANILLGGATIGAGFNRSSRVAVAKAMETAINATPPKQGEGGFARIAMLVLLAIGAAVLLSGCTTTPVDVIQTACTRGTTYTAERCAKGVGETYEVYQKRAADIVANPAAPAEVKEAVKAAESLASDVVVKTLKAGAFYAEVKQQLAAGLTTEEQVAIANASLEAWVAKAIPLIRSFGDALGR